MILSIMCEYEMVSGQVVNLLKSSVCFSKNVKHNFQEEMALLMGVTRVD